MTCIARSSILLGFLLVFTFSSVHARTWYVTVDGSGDAPTIQAAIDSCTVDDTVLVAAGAYTWSNQGTGNEYGMLRVLAATNLLLVSESGPDMTVLDGQGLGRILLYSGDTPGLTVDGFTFRRGVATETGNGIYVGGGMQTHESSPVVRNCVFQFCQAKDDGGAVWHGGLGSPRFENCVFEENSARLGGALFVINTALTVSFTNCEIRGNTAGDFGGGLFGHNVPLRLVNCVVEGNTAGLRGGGIALGKCKQPVVRRCTFRANSAPTGGGIMLFQNNSLSVDHTIISESVAGGSAALNATSSINFSCSDLFGNNGGDWIGAFAGQYGANGNFTADPLYCDPTPGSDLELDGASPCAPGNHPDGNECGLIGAAPVGCGVPVVGYLDINPGSCRNPLNVTVPKGEKANGGVLPVAILGSDELDVRDIDVSSLELEGAAPLRHGYHDVATPPSGDDDCACSEAGPDGYVDLTLKFGRLDVVAGLGNASGDGVPVRMTGRMKDGTAIELTDCVDIVPRKGEGGPVLTSSEEPAVTALRSATPNPFNPTTVIGYELEEQAYATLTVYDVTGRLVATLVEGELPGGRHNATWEAQGVPSGVYFCRLTVGDFSETRKMVLLK
jgi:hypothetical protein